jgi:hypothetical protein
LNGREYLMDEVAVWTKVLASSEIMPQIYCFEAAFCGIETVSMVFRAVSIGTF